MDYDVEQYSAALKASQTRFVNEEVLLDQDSVREFDESFAKFLRLGRKTVPELDSVMLDDSVDPLIIQTAWQIAFDIKDEKYTPELAAREIVYFSIFLLNIGNKEEGAVSTADNFRNNFTDLQESNFLHSWDLGFRYISKAVQLADLTSEEKDVYLKKMKEVLEASNNATQLRILV